MAENLYRALWSLLICVVVTVVVSLLTKPKTAEELQGLVRGYTEIPSEGGMPFYQRRCSGALCWASSSRFCSGFSGRRRLRWAGGSAARRGRKEIEAADLEVGTC